MNLVSFLVSVFQVLVDRMTCTRVELFWIVHIYKVIECILNGIIGQLNSNLWHKSWGLNVNGSTKIRLVRKKRTGRQFRISYVMGTYKIKRRPFYLVALK